MKRPRKKLARVTRLRPKQKPAPGSLADMSAEDREAILDVFRTLQRWRDEAREKGIRVE